MNDRVIVPEHESRKKVWCLSSRLQVLRHCLSRLPGFCRPCNRSEQVYPSKTVLLCVAHTRRVQSVGSMRVISLTVRTGRLLLTASTSRHLLKTGSPFRTLSR